MLTSRSPYPLALRPASRLVLRHRVVLGASDSSSQSPSPGGAGEEPGVEPPGLSSAMHYSLSEVAKLQGRKTNSTNLFLVNESEESWRRLDKKVNKYPIQRSFTGIGSGGEEFKAALLLCVESVVGPVHIECVSERKSSKGSYQSITVGPVWVETCDQVIEIYAKLKQVENIKWII